MNKGKKNWYHRLRKVGKINMQNDFIFYDTESSSTNIDNREKLKFKMGYTIFWNKETNETIKKTYFNYNKFWLDVLKRFNYERNRIFLFAHNHQFDFKMVNGFKILLKKDWKLINFYVQNKTFILTFKKSNGNKKRAYYLHAVDTMNFVQKELKELGKAVNLKKLEIDFNKTTLSKLHIYCKRDTQIIFEFMKYLINFLEKNDLSKLKATSGSLAFNTFRHKFYDFKNKTIFIHACERAIALERNSYKGGISDCFRLGEFKNSIKTDINSMYPFIMKTYKLPRKLVLYTHCRNNNQQILRKIIEISENNEYGFIAKIKAYLPKDKAYILHKVNNKILFTYGIFETTLCKPELDYIEKYGKILYIYELSVYLMDNIFYDYVNFFYNLKVESQKTDNKVITEFAKLMLNTLYGKFGQKQILYERLTIDNKWFIENQYILKEMIIKYRDILPNSSIVYLGTIVNDCEVYLINHNLYRLKNLPINSYESFVAISSFITSHARMLLVNYIEKAKRENVYYSDTDSIICNQQGYNNLLKHNCIDKYELGKLKVEGKGTAKIYAPKFYDFNESRKIKGVRQKASKLIKENKELVIYEIQNWFKLKSDLKKGNTNTQIIEKSIKTIHKLYDKGKIDDLGYITPYSITEALALF